MILKNVSDFLKYDIVTKFNLINENPITFPTITFCNMNGFTSIKSFEILSNITKNKIYQNQTNSTHSSQNELNEIENEFRIHVASLDDETKKLFGVQLNETLIRCIFKYAFKLIIKF